MPPSPHASVLIIGHGSERNPRALVSAEDHAARLRATGRFRSVGTAYLKGGRTPADALRAQPPGELFAVPLFMSDGYYTQTAIPKMLGLTGRITEADGRRLVYCDPVGLDPRIPGIIAESVVEVTGREGIAPSAAELLVVGHGSPSNPASRAITLAHARRLGTLAPFRSIACAFLDEDPTIEDWMAGLAPTGAPLIVTGYFAADGLHASTDVPAVIAEWGERAAAEAGPAARKVWYAGAVGSRPAVTELIMAAIETAMMPARG